MPEFLIVGKGNAGLRHGRDLKLAVPSANITWVDPDKNKQAHFDTLVAAQASKQYDLTVICSPPKAHIHQALRSAMLGSWVLCEKPLCDWGQVGQIHGHAKLAEKIMMAYNYRFHPALQYGGMPLSPRSDSILADWEIRSHQNTGAEPAWGFLLDSVSHALDIIWRASGLPLTIRRAKVVTNANGIHWYVSGKVGRSETFIIEDVHRNFGERSVVFRCKRGQFNITPSPTMFFRMYESLFYHMKSGTMPSPNIYDAIYIQHLLEDVRGAVYGSCRPETD